MSPEERRRTFISYSRINKEFALKLALELRSSGFDIWLDQLDIPTGARWDNEVERALRECGIFMVILTPASSASDNVKDEIGFAIDTGKHILPILLENADIPLRLRRFQYIDFTTKSYEEGVESAKQLLRNLLEVPTGSQAQRSDVSQTRVHAEREVEESAQPLKRTPSVPLIFGLGVGIIALLVVGALIIPRLFTPTDPFVDDIQPDQIPISGDPACPVDNIEPVEVTFENATALTFDYYLVDSDCQERPYGTLIAYGSTTISTYVTHTWNFYDNQNGEYFFSYFADGGDYLQISGEVADSGVTAETVTYVNYDGGEFEMIGENEWIERFYASVEEYHFEEIERDEWSVYLYDPSRNINIELALWTREILLDDNSGQGSIMLYTIAEAEE